MNVTVSSVVVTDYKKREEEKELHSDRAKAKAFYGFGSLHLSREGGHLDIQWAWGKLILQRLLPKVEYADVTGLSSDIHGDISEWWSNLLLNSALEIWRYES